jgi:hypothetical protein
METIPVPETEHLHFFFYSLLLAILENELNGKAHEVDDLKEIPYCVLLPEKLLTGKTISTYNYQRTSHLPKVKYFVKFEV